MHIHHLHLLHFRNHADTTIEPMGKSVVLIGHNGAGKTNILEAVSLLSPGRGLRQAKLRQITSQSAPVSQGWVVHVVASGLQGEVALGTALDMQAATDRRIVKAQGEKLKSQSDLSSHLAIIWQTPQMDGLFLAGTSARRTFFDRLVFACDASHAARVANYEQLMRERNKLLEQGTRDEDWLGSVEANMASHAVAIAAARNQLLERLKLAMQAATGHFPLAALSLEGGCEQALSEGQSATDVEQELATLLAERRTIDRAAGRTTRGAHRTDLRVRFGADGADAAGCSTGEQKALLLSIMLAHARARKTWLGAAPILLFDEVVAHLDIGRRKALFGEIEALGAQTFMTGTDAADFSGMGSHVLFCPINQGKLTVAG